MPSEYIYIYITVFAADVVLPAVPAGTKEVPGDSSNPEPRMPLPSATAVSKPTEQSPAEQKEGDDAIQSHNPESLRLTDERAGLLKSDQHVARVQAPAEVPAPMPHGPRFLDCLRKNR